MNARRSAWLLPTAFALHEIEEWNILGWYDEHWVNVDPVTMTPLSVHVWLVLVSVLGFLITWACVASRRFGLWVRLVLLPTFVVFVFGHAFAHVVWTVRFASYSPGVVTAVALVVPATLYFLIVARRQGIVSMRYMSCVLAAAVLPLLAAVLAGNSVPPGGVPWLRFSTWLIDRW